MLAASLKEVYKNTNTPTYHLRTVLAFYKNIKGFTVYGNKMSSSRKKKKKNLLLKAAQRFTVGVT